MAKKEKAKVKKKVSVKTKKKKQQAPQKTIKTKKLLVEQLVNAIVEGMENKKADDIVSIDLRSINNSITDFFVICHGNSKVHIEAIADSVEETVEKMIKEKALHIEGKTNSQWILIDYFNVMVHIFSKEAREFYNIENLWADGKMKAAASK